MVGIDVDDEGVEGDGTLKERNQGANGAGIDFLDGEGDGLPAIS